MKLVIAVIQDKDAPKLLDLLVENGFSATKLASTGGFLKGGNTTLLVGTDEERVNDVVGIITKTCRSRKQMVTPLPVGGPGESYIPSPVEITVGGATVFVVDVAQFIKI
jgi:uncharacterized protein YaaQ